MSSETAMRATLRAPTGFSEPSHYESEVSVHGFTYGKHLDGAGYGRQAECTLAIIADGDRLIAVPLDWLRLPRQPPTGGEK